MYKTTVKISFVQNIMAYETRDTSPSIVNSLQDGDDWLASPSCRFSARETAEY